MAGMLQMRRSRGAASGFLLVLLGAWGALIPFIGPYFHYAYTPDTAWTYTTARLGSSATAASATSSGAIRPSLARCWARPTAALTRARPSLRSASASRGSASTRSVRGTWRRISTTRTLPLGWNTTRACG